jgi:hypothetical protein
VVRVVDQIDDVPRSLVFLAVLVGAKEKGARKNSAKQTFFAALRQASTIIPVS